MVANSKFPIFLTKWGRCCVGLKEKSDFEVFLKGIVWHFGKLDTTLMFEQQISKLVSYISIKTWKHVILIVSWLYNSTYNETTSLFVQEHKSSLLALSKKAKYCISQNVKLFIYWSHCFKMKDRSLLSCFFYFSSHSWQAMEQWKVSYFRDSWGL